MSFGAVAVAAGIIALEPAFATGAALGIALVAIGLGISFDAAEQWGLLGTATTIIGALLLAGGIIGFVEADFTGLAFSALLFLALAIAIRSNFLMALVPLTLVDARQRYRLHARRVHADCERALDHDRVLCVPRGCRVPSLAARRASLSAVADHLCPSVADPRQLRLLDRLAVGRYPGETWAQGEGLTIVVEPRGLARRSLHVPEIAFIIGWAIVIIAVGAWAARTNRRWVVTTAAFFGAIEFYTQWFERLGAEPWAIIVAGLTIVAFAIALWRYNLTGGRPATFTA